MIDKLKHLLHQLLKNLFGSNPPREEDPYAYSPVRSRRGPNDRSGSVAVAEPDEE